MNFDIVESLEENIKIYQTSKMILLKSYLKITINTKTKYLDNLNCWFVDEYYIKYLLDFKKEKFVDDIVKVFKEKLPVDEGTIFIACRRNNLKMVKMLFSIFKNKLPICFMAIHIACYNNNTEIVKELIKNYGKDLPIDIKTIYWACKNGNIEIVKELIKNYGNELPIDESSVIIAYNNKEILEILVDTFKDKLPINKDKIKKFCDTFGIQILNIKEIKKMSFKK